jgi:Tol biopolymer transport system component
MPLQRLAFTFLLLLVLAACTEAPADPVATATYDATADSLRFEGEAHLRNIRQLTFGGNNAEAYWSNDGTQLVFQSDWNQINPQGCDQIFVMNADGSAVGDSTQYAPISTMRGRTTCSYFLADGRVVYASTHGDGPDCPEAAPFVNGRYVWPIYDAYDIYVTDPANPDEDPAVLIGGDGYDAEATVSPDGRYVVYTSTRSGDLELWRRDLETGEDLQLTDELGYDGGAFFSPDGSKLVWRASRPTEGEAADTYRGLLDQGLVQPTNMDLFVADADGSNARQVTALPGAQWAPYFHPDNERILFASNHHAQEGGGREFAIFMINPGEGPPSLQQITHSGTFDAFPMFSPDGTQLVFASNRRVDRQPSRDTNVFVADWVEDTDE